MLFAGKENYQLADDIFHTELFDISIVEGQLLIRSIVTINRDLAHLLSGITEANLHNECDTGEAVGIENW